MGVWKVTLSFQTGNCICFILFRFAIQIGVQLVHFRLQLSITLQSVQEGGNWLIGWSRVSWGISLSIPIPLHALALINWICLDWLIVSLCPSIMYTIHWLAMSQFLPGCLPSFTRCIGLIWVSQQILFWVYCAFATQMDLVKWWKFITAGAVSIFFENIAQMS